MKITVYPTEKDYKDRTNGVQVTGQKWADAPGAGNMWVVLEGARKPILVSQRANSHDGKPFAIGEPVK